MKKKIEKKYITLPVNILMKKKKVSFYHENALVFDLDAHVDVIAPNFTAYVDVSRFLGMELDIKCDPEIDFTVGQSDSMDLEEMYREPYRPFVHFTVKNGWNNDPNGLVKFGDVYHMFYQYNPCSVIWGNMHWGHAVSRDLLHWEELDTALFPDETGTMFSGGAILDRKNKTGLKENENDVILLFYTAAGSDNLLSRGKRFTQRLAYSADGGITFKKYTKNPILEHIEAANRDPHVIWCDPLGKYLMSIYLNENRFLLLVSENLLNWTPLQELSLENETECPNTFPLKAKNEENGQEKWVIIGASDVYAVGCFKNGKFCAEQKHKRLHYGKSAYAAQSFSGIENENRCVRMYWNRTEIPYSPFSQQMGFPVEMNLEKIEGEYYLCANPIEEITSLYKKTEEFENQPIQAGNAYRLKTEPKGEAYDILLEADYLPGAVLKLEIFGLEIICDIEKNNIAVNESRSPLSVLAKKIELRLIIDKCSAELFADGGKFCFTERHICDYNINSLILSCEKDIIIKRLRCSSLKSIWTK